MELDIPFYAAASTTQSHNVGVNIQEVMGAMKNTRRKNDIHFSRPSQSRKMSANLNKIPLRSLLSTIHDKTSLVYPSLSTSSLDYGEFQDLKHLYNEFSDGTAKYEEDYEDNLSDSKTVILNGPAGDTYMDNKNIQVTSPKQKFDGILKTTNKTSLSSRSLSDSKKENRCVQAIVSKVPTMNKTYTNICMSSPNYYSTTNKTTPLNKNLPNFTKKLNPKSLQSTKLEKTQRPLPNNTYQQIHGKNRNIVKKKKSPVERSQTFSSGLNEQEIKSSKYPLKSLDFMKEARKEILNKAVNLGSKAVNNVNTLCSLFNEESDEIEDLEKENFKSPESKMIDTVVTIRQMIHGKKGSSNEIHNGHNNGHSNTTAEMDELFTGIKDIFNNTDLTPYDDGSVLYPETNDYNNYNEKLTLHQDNNNFDYKVNAKNFVFNGKENLQRVLVQLHDEFDNLNRKYDYLTTLATRAGYKEVEVELERTDFQLNKKEDEILTILSLCKEVLNLRQQMGVIRGHSNSIRDNATSTSFNDIYRKFNRRSDIAILPFS